MCANTCPCLGGRGGYHRICLHNCAFTCPGLPCDMGALENPLQTPYFHVMEHWLNKYLPHSQARATQWADTTLIHTRCLQHGHLTGQNKAHEHRSADALSQKDFIHVSFEASLVLTYFISVVNSEAFRVYMYISYSLHISALKHVGEMLQLKMGGRTASSQSANRGSPWSVKRNVLNWQICLNYLCTIKITFKWFTNNNSKKQYLFNFQVTVELMKYLYFPHTKCKINRRKSAQFSITKI